MYNIIIYVKNKIINTKYMKRKKKPRESYDDENRK